MTPPLATLTKQGTDIGMSFSDIGMSLEGLDRSIQGCFSVVCHKSLSFNDFVMRLPWQMTEVANRSIPYFSYLSHAPLMTTVVNSLRRRDYRPQCM
jgi:hypothetical protein